MSAWFTYILHCADDSLYTGISKDIPRRIVEHNTDNKLGAKYTRGRRPVKLVYQEQFDTRSAAAKREHEIKQMLRHQKEQLIKSARL